MIHISTMGGVCSKKKQPESVRFQKDNTSNEPSEVGEPRMLPIPGAPGDWEIYYRVLIIDGYHTVTIFVMKYKPQDVGIDEPQDVGIDEPRFIPICFFKMKKIPSKITFEMLENRSFSIKAYISEETSGEIMDYCITWESNNYTIQEDGVFIDCVKKIQSTDNPRQFVSSLKLKSLSEEKGSSNGSQSGGSAEVHSAERVSPVVEINDGTGASVSQVDVPRLSVDSQTNGSATPAPEVVERNSLQLNEQQPLTYGHSAVKFSERIHQVSMTLGINLEFLKETITGVSRGDDVNIHQDFARCGRPMIKSTLAVEVVGGTVVNQRTIKFSSNAISQVIKHGAVNVSIKICVNCVNFSVIFAIPAQAVEEIINFCRANGPDVLRTVSRCIEQIGGLLQLDYDPSKTALVLYDAVSDNTRKFLSWMFQKMKQIISLLERRELSEDATGWEIVECVTRVAPSVEVVSSNRSASSALVLVLRESPEHLHSRPSFDTGIDGVNVVYSFSDKRYTYDVYDNCIKYSIGPDTIDVNFGIPFGAIKKIVVYKMTNSVFLIVIRTFDEQIYLSGHSTSSTLPLFAKAQITSYSFSGERNLFEYIEFDPRNVLHFQINTTNWTKFFSIDEFDGSIQQHGCQWKKL